MAWEKVSEDRVNGVIMYQRNWDNILFSCKDTYIVVSTLKKDGVVLRSKDLEFITNKAKELFKE